LEGESRKVLHREGRKELEPIVRDLTGSLNVETSDEGRMRILIETWGFGLPMASAILSVLWPDNFTVYDVRVREGLGGFFDFSGATRFATLWEGYLKYRAAVSAAVPEATLSLRQKDRHLWAMSTMKQLQSDIAKGFVHERSSPK
jgi:hypothetical protein